MAWGNYRGLIPGFFLTFFWVFAGNIPRIPGFTGFPKIPGFTGFPRIAGFTEFPQNCRIYRISQKNFKKNTYFFFKSIDRQGKRCYTIFRKKIINNKGEWGYGKKKKNYL
jgi:hypothetical protein